MRVGFFFHLNKALVRNRNPGSARGETWGTKAVGQSHIAVVFLFKIPNLPVFFSASFSILYLLHHKLRGRGFIFTM